MSETLFSGRAVVLSSVSFKLSSAGIWFQPISFVLSCFVSFAPYQDFYLLSCFVFVGLIELWLSLPYRAFLFSHALILFWYFIQNQSVSPSCSTICSDFNIFACLKHCFFLLASQCWVTAALQLFSLLWGGTDSSLKLQFQCNFLSPHRGVFTLFCPPPVLVV